MDGMDAAVESPEVVESGGTDVEAVEQPEVSQPEGKEDDNPYSSKASREYSQWLKALRDADPNNAKWARLSKDNHARLYQLQQLEPKGIDGIRERYSQIDSIMHGDLKGIEAVTAMQDAIQSVSAFDERVVNGDITALDELAPEMRAGVFKMMPDLLSMAQKEDPEGYSKAVLPHFVEALRNSDLVGSFNGLVDVLNEQPPSWLTENQKAQWTADRLNRVMGHAGKMAQWFNTQDQQAKGLKNPDRQSPNGQKPPVGAAKPESDIDQREKTFHWEKNIYPGLDKHAAQRFSELFRPYAQRLRLDNATSEGLKMEFSKRVAATAMKNPIYKSQIGRYWGMKSPDPATVTNFAKVEFDKHAKSVMEGLIKERYSPFLNGKPKTAVQNGNGNGNGAAKPGPVAPGVQIVAVKPPMDQIDHKNTPLDWLHQKKYRLTNGKVVQVRN